MKNTKNPDKKTVDRIIEMAWEDRTPFDVIEAQFGFTETEVIRLMRSELKRKSFLRWRKRVSGRKTKHEKLLNRKGKRFKSTRQREISGNQIT
jgi:uncharacterized protein (TIGR03643 family)